MSGQIMDQTPLKVHAPTRKGILQRKCSKCSDHDNYKKQLLHRSAIQDSTQNIPQIVHEVLREYGQPLDAETRAFMEPRFGHDFSSVRVHIDAKAAESAQAVNALAYTVGRDIVFDEGRYAPHSAEGQRLLSHELAHVVQQSQTSNNLRIQRKVSRCCREVRTGKPILDIPASAFGYEHCWLKTDTKTVGMGPAKEGPLPSWPFGTDTKLTDHSKEPSDSCQEISAINENCVNEALVIDKPTGKWSISNNCNTLADEIINSCRESTAPSALRMEPVETIKLSDDPSRTIFKLSDRLSFTGATYRWRLFDSNNQHYLLRGADGSQEVLDWLSFTSNSRALIGQKTRELLMQRGVTSGLVQCTVRSPYWQEDKVVKMPIMYSR